MQPKISPGGRAAKRRQADDRAERAGPSFERRGLAGLATAVALSLGGGAAAQEPEIDEVLVTGTRIERAIGFTTPVPITAVSSDELLAFEPGTTLAAQLDWLPQFFNTANAQDGSNALFGDAGGSYLNMRGLGRARTLVLIDGARTVPADRASRVNIDNIPSALLERVEVVTGGASAAYGADALAGVTNFILNRRYEGFDLDVATGATEQGDGRHWQISVTGGTALTDRLHFVGSWQSQRIDQIARGRDATTVGGWYRRYGFVRNPDWSPSSPPGVPQRLIVPEVYSSLHAPGGLINQPGFVFDRHVFTADGTSVRPFVVGAFDSQSGPGALQTQAGGVEFENATRAFDGGPVSSEVVRNNGFIGLDFNASERTTIYGHLLFGSTESNRPYARAVPHLSGIWRATIFSGNPFLPSEVQAAMDAEGLESIRVDKLGTIFGPDNSNYNEHDPEFNSFDTWSLALGLDQDIGEKWNMRLSLQRGETDKVTTTRNRFRADRAFVAIDAVEVYADRRDADGNGVIDVVAPADRGTGDIICNVQRYNPTPAELQAAVADIRVPSVQGDDSLGAPDELVPIPGPLGPDNVIEDCVPLNIFGHGNASPEAATFPQSDKSGVGAVVQEFAELLFSGDVAEGWAGPIALAGGLTYREEKFWQRGLPREIMKYGPPRNAPDLGIRGIPPGYANGSANLHMFSTVPAIKGGFDVWEIFTELDVPLWDGDGERGLGLNVAARRSDYSLGGEVTSHKTGLGFQVSDTLRLRATFSHDVREATFAERFDLQGGGSSVDDPEMGNASFSITRTSGGNPNLRPEEADTITAGLVYQPAAIPGLQISADWYEIDLSDAIGQLGSQTIVDQCFESGILCEQITRDSATGVITKVRDVFLNIDKARVRGVDYEVLFNTGVDWTRAGDESLSFRLLAGYLGENSETPFGGTRVEHAGAYQTPSFKAVASVDYRFGDYRVGLQQRYLDGGLLNDEWVEGIDVDDNTVESQVVTNLTFGWQKDLANGRAMGASLIVTNLLDTDPPVVASFAQSFSGYAQTASTIHDLYGRRYSLTFRYGF